METALGIDIGTGSTKVGLVDAEGCLVAVARAANPIEEPEPGWSEADPAAWLASTERAVREVLAAHPDREVVTVGLSGQMHGVVLTGRSGQPVRPAVLWSDRRAESILAEVANRLGPAELGRLGNPIVAGMAGPILAAIGREEPGAVDRARWALQPKDWLRLQLTGEPATDPSDASATLLWDVGLDGWSSAACDAFGVDPALLPPVVPSAGSAGRIVAAFADRLGVPAGTPVATGAADTAAALLGAGIGLGETQLSTGTGGQLARIVDEPVIDGSGRTHLLRATDPARWYAMAAIQNAGLAIEWALGVLGMTMAEADRVMATADGAVAGSDGVTFVPYLTGERTPHMDAGLSGRWLGLRSGTSRSAMVRSVFEGVAFALADGLAALADAGHDPAELLLAGGGSITPWWRQLLADVLRRPLVPHTAVDASVRGAGLLAWSAVGNEIDHRAAVSRRPPVLADPSSIEVYEAAAARYRQAVAISVDP